MAVAGAGAAAAAAGGGGRGGGVVVVVVRKIDLVVGSDYLGGIVGRKPDHRGGNQQANNTFSLGNFRRLCGLGLTRGDLLIRT